MRLLTCTLATLVALPSSPTNNPDPVDRTDQQQPSSPAEGSLNSATPSSSMNEADDAQRSQSTEQEGLSSSGDQKNVEAQKEKLPPGQYEIRTMKEDLQRIEKGGPIRPDARSTHAVDAPPPPSPSSSAAPPKTKQQQTASSLPSVIPDGSQKQSTQKRMWTIIIVGIVIAAVAVGAAWLFLLNPADKQPLPPTNNGTTPPPTVTLLSPLEALYPETAPVHLVPTTEAVTAASASALGTMLETIRNEERINDGTVAHIRLLSATTGDDVLSIANIALPDDIVAALEAPEPYAPMLVGINPGGDDPTHFGLMLALGDRPRISLLRNALRRWEWRMDDDLSVLFSGLTKGVSSSTTYQEVTYRGAVVRYRNFTSPSVTIDYALVESTEPPVAIITTSRESMFAIIDLLFAP